MNANGNAFNIDGQYIPKSVELCLTLLKAWCCIVENTDRLSDFIICPNWSPLNADHNSVNDYLHNQRPAVILGQIWGIGIVLSSLIDNFSERSRKIQNGHLTTLYDEELWVGPNKETHFDLYSQCFLSITFLC